MSETELRIGKVKEIAKDQKTFEDKIEFIIINITSKLPYYDIEDEYIENPFVYINGRMFHIIEDKNYEYEDVYEITDKDEDTYSYVLKYYNGGCGFNEALEDALKGYEKKNDKKIL